MEKKINPLASLCILFLAAIVIAFLLQINAQYQKNNNEVLPHDMSAENLPSKVIIGSTIVAVKIADTPAGREQGLSGSDPLAPDTGMLFIFPTDGIYAFWMKDMRYPIDMIWLSADKKVVYIKSHATPDSDPEHFTPDTPARYVLEVPDGFADANHLATGDQAQFQ